MTNEEYVRTYWRQRLALKFCPEPQLIPQDFDIVVYALISRTLAARLPRPGDVVWVRSLDQASQPWAESKWARHDVDGVGIKDGVEVECMLDDGTILTRAYYHQTWRFDADHGPKEVLS